ncbi:hypothetical protein [Enterococcus saccharolyticus]|uniref:hypothetical protein n=1 Tax=Enterococcus saccharolyticus TaxID=41997 RepID=UPI0039E00505
MAQPPELISWDEIQKKIDASFRAVVQPVKDPKIIIGKHELKVSTLEKLIEFAESGKLDAIMENDSNG